MLTFYRGAFTQVEITISASESLGLLDSDYIEDYYGVDGQLTLRRSASAFEVAVLVFPDGLETPSIPNDVFRGLIPLASLADGTYSLLGRVRDTLGNSTILGSVQGGGIGAVVNLDFRVLAGQGAYYSGETLRASIGLNVFITLRATKDIVSLGGSGVGVTLHATKDTASLGSSRDSVTLGGRLRR